MKRYGIFGGSFNPPHVAHLILAENVKEQLELDKVIFIPSGKHALKDSGLQADAEQRLCMARIAFEKDSCFEVNDIEIRKAKSGITNYTVDTMIDLYNKYQSDFIKLYLIIGIDNLIEFPQWKDPHKLFVLTEVIVINRPGYLIQDVSVEFSRKARYLSVPMLEISSTDIRNRVRENKSIKYLVDPEIENYIRNNNLYK
jgi:nicotinate-nucleotide adenylyltransferase